MNTIHNNGENDKSLNQGLDELSRSYGQLAKDEPPELLDQAILNSAHRAVEKKPHWMRFGWLHGLTTAAVFVLAFSLILNQSETEPVFEDSIENNRSEILPREMLSGKQASDIQTDTPALERKAISDDQQDFFQNIPVASAPDNTAEEVVPEKGARQAFSKVQRSAQVQDNLPGASGTAEEDSTKAELLQEETTRDDAELVVGFAAKKAVYKTSSPAAIAEPAAGKEAEARSRTDPEIEQRLLTIIELKKAGDSTWKTELKLFKNDYPHYPLPDELGQ